MPSSPVDLSRSGARCVDHKVFNLVFFVGRPHNQTQILLAIIFNTLFKEESATVEVSAEFLKDSIRYTYIPTYLHTCSIMSGSAFLDLFLCRDLTIFSVASEARTWLPGLEQVLQAHNDLPDKVVECPVYSV